jgi:hypothetical protein
MTSCIIEVSEKYAKRGTFSLQPHHMDSFDSGNLETITLINQTTREVIAVLTGQRLREIMLEAKRRGPRFIGNDIFWVGDIRK